MQYLKISEVAQINNVSEYVVRYRSGLMSVKLNGRCLQDWVDAANYLDSKGDRNHAAEYIGCLPRLLPNGKMVTRKFSQCDQCGDVYISENGAAHKCQSSQ